MGHGGQRGKVGDIAQRVAHGFAVHRLGAGVDQFGKRGWIARIGKSHLNAHLGKGVRKQVVGATVQRGAGHDVVTRFGNGLNRVGDCRHARGHGQRANAALHGRHTGFQHAIGGVHDAAVDVARHLQVKQVGTVLGVVKRIGHGLVNGYRHSLGSGVRRVATVNCQCFNLHEVISLDLFDMLAATG